MKHSYLSLNSSLSFLPSPPSFSLSPFGVSFLPCLPFFTLTEHVHCILLPTILVSRTPRSLSKARSPSQCSCAVELSWSLHSFLSSEAGGAEKEKALTLASAQEESLQLYFKAVSSMSLHLGSGSQKDSSREAACTSSCPHLAQHSCHLHFPSTCSARAALQFSAFPTGHLSIPNFSQGIVHCCDWCSVTKWHGFYRPV